jgi:predicted MFS family arabinose efflux permease
VIALWLFASQQSVLYIAPQYIYMRVIRVITAFSISPRFIS